MSKRKKIIIALASVALVIACFVAAYFIMNYTSDDDTRGRLAVYFYKPSAGKLEAEFRVLHPEQHLQVQSAVHDLATGPNTALSGVWPAGLRDFVDTHVDQNILVANFSEAYNDFSPLDEVIFRSAFTLTMLGIPNIDGVLFRVKNENGTEEFLETATTITNNPFISPARRTAENFTLFFLDETGEGLVTMLSNAEYVNVHARAQYILSLLIEGQNAPGIFPLIPPETRVRDVFVEPDSGIYVNLSSEFHSRFGGTPAQARMMIQSITHTILENERSNVQRRVFFLIDSERWDDFHGVSDFNLGFTIDKTMMLDYEEEDEE